jgi:hypothetical protein
MDELARNNNNNKIIILVSVSGKYRPVWRGELWTNSINIVLLLKWIIEQ